MLTFMLWRQIIAETLFIFDVIFAVVLIRYLWINKSGQPWWEQVHLQGAFAFLTLIVGHILIRGWSIVSFVAIKRQGASIFDMENWLPVSFVGTIIAVIGMIWCIRVFSPGRWGEVGWIVAVILAGCFVAAMRLV